VTLSSTPSRAASIAISVASHDASAARISHAGLGADAAADRGRHVGGDGAGRTLNSKAQAVLAHRGCRGVCRDCLVRVLAQMSARRFDCTSDCFHLDPSQIGLVALIVEPIAPNLAAFRRVSASCEREYVSMSSPCLISV